MYFRHTVIALAAAVVTNAQLPDIPECSTKCFVSALSSDGCSNLTDFACHCGKQELPGKITPCVKDACPVDQQSSVSNLVVSQCQKAGVPIELPPIEGGKGGGGDATTTGGDSQPTGGGSASDSGPVSSPHSSPTGSPTPSATPSPSDSASPSPTGGTPPSQPSPTDSKAGSSLDAKFAGVAAILLAVAAYI